MPTEQPAIRERISPVRCGHCNWPTTHADLSVAGAAGRGLCTRCTRDETGGKIKVYTYWQVVQATS